MSNQDNLKVLVLRVWVSLKALESLPENVRMVLAEALKCRTELAFNVQRSTSTSEKLGEKLAVPHMHDHHLHQWIPNSRVSGQVLGITCSKQGGIVEGAKFMAILQ
jgi:hypothetical protein